MRYEGKMYRPPSEADSLIIQATIGCSWNHCTYCDMYREKSFRVRPLEETLEDLALTARALGSEVARVEKVFVADGDALVLPTPHWLALLEQARALFPRLTRVSCYAMARNVLEKSDAELRDLARSGLSLLYIGPESGDDATLKSIAKGDDAAAHVEAARRAHAAGMKLSVIGLLGIGGARWEAHAEGTGKLISAMDPAFFSALTVTVVPGTPLAKLTARGKFAVPEVPELLRELRLMVASAEPRDCVFRTNHASNYLPLGGRLPSDQARIVATIDRALEGKIPLRPDYARGL